MPQEALKNISWMVQIFCFCGMFHRFSAHIKHDYVDKSVVQTAIGFSIYKERNFTSDHTSD